MCIQTSVAVVDGACFAISRCCLGNSISEPSDRFALGLEQFPVSLKVASNFGVRPAHRGIYPIYALDW